MCKPEGTYRINERNAAYSRLFRVQHEITSGFLHRLFFISVKTLIPYLLINNYVTASYSTETSPYWEIFFKFAAAGYQIWFEGIGFEGSYFPLHTPSTALLKRCTISKKKKRIFEFQATVFMKRM